MVFKYEWDLVECKMWNWRLKLLSKCPCSWLGILDSFSMQVALMKHIFLIGFDSMQHWTATARIRKRLKHTENFFRKPIVNRCMLILELNSYPKSRTTEASDGFLHLRKTSLETRWEGEHFRLFFVFLVAGLVDLSWESPNFSIAPNTEKGM